MNPAASPLTAFHRIGDRAALKPVLAESAELRPALFGAYNDLSHLRTDFPVVLAPETSDAPWVVSLCDLTDEFLENNAEPGTRGEELRRQMLAQEHSIRRITAGGQEGSFSDLWAASGKDLLGTCGDSEAERKALESALGKAFEALDHEGEVAKFDEKITSRLVRRAWLKSENLKSARMRKRIDRLVQKLSDILKVNDMHSPKARQAGQLEGTVGSADRDVFDFQAMARILKTAPVAEPLPARRLKRIRRAIDVLSSQKFFCEPDRQASRPSSCFNFFFEDCQAALQAYQERLPAMAELVRAIAIAELEIDNHYKEDQHEHYFGTFDENRLGPRDMELFPSYLVCLRPAGEEEQEQLIRILRAGLPFKLVAQLQDVLGEDSPLGGRLTFGIRGQQLARMALGLDQVFVLQAAAACLYRMRDQVYNGVTSADPALFSIYTGSSYLESAAANESRAFTSFVYDPCAGRDQASCFSVTGNPAPDTDWTMHDLAYELPEHDLQSERTAFTLVDFAAQFPEFIGRFACIHHDDWTDDLVPVSEFLALPEARKADKVPYVPLIDGDNTLYRGVVSEKLLDAAERCLTAWHNLQELAGINNSHAASAVARAKEVWEEKYVPKAAEPEAKAEAAVAAPAPAAPETEKQVPEPEEKIAPSSSDDPWIETIRCTSCNECTQVNDRMFAYDGEKRAYIADPDAGTYRELVEAAETCQVAIIHPGKPRNPDEPGLEELLERAAPFL